MAHENLQKPVDLMCRGKSPLFKGNVCEYLNRKTGACELLAEVTLEKICDQGRCIFALIGYAEERLARKFCRSGSKEDFPILDNRENIDINGLLRRLKKVKWGRSDQPSVWLSYLMQSITRAVLEVASRNGRLPRRKQCGTCVHLPESPPLICQEINTKRNKTESICSVPPYAPKMPLFSSESHYTENTGLDGTTDTMARRVPEALRTQPSSQEAVEQIHDISSVMAKLREQAMAERSNSKKREVYSRQHDLLSRLYSLIRSGCSEKEALNFIVNETGVHPKTISRDLNEIREIFAREMSV